MRPFYSRTLIWTSISSFCSRNAFRTHSALKGQYNFSKLRCLHSGSTFMNRSSERHEDLMSKNTDYLHVQNILLRKNQERMNKKQVLSEATNFYERFKINTKWLLIRGNRPFSANEISTMFSWLLISQIVWIILGTTTFVSILLLIFNTVFAKEMVGKCIGKLLNVFLEDVDIKFEDALVPEWKKGCIRFNKVELKTINRDDSVDQSADNSEQNLKFSLKFHEIELTLSLKKWLLGNGPINDLSVYGMRGDVSVNYAYEQTPQDLFIDWFSNKEYRLGRVQLTDSCVNIHDEQLDMKYRVSIYNLVMPQLRFEWMIPDFFNADVATGAINHSLFTIHKRQHKLVYSNELERDLSPWKRITRLKLDSINVKDLGLNKSNVFNWFEDGNLEITADIMLPHESDENKENKYMVLDFRFKFKDLRARFPDNAPRLSTGEELISLEELKPLISFINTQNGYFRSMVNIENTNAVWNAPNVSVNKVVSYPNVTVIPSAQWNDGEDEVGSKGQEIIKFHEQPFHNNNEIVLRCRIAKNIQELNDKVMFQETGVYDTLSMELYVDLIRMVEEWEYKKKNDFMKLWGTTVASQLLLFGIGAMV
ncbi:Mdm32p TDEL_0A03470 [Torulaspora delbrueckii]|uniref:Mitochondrial distribution and morphology protein 32 n=1 Tax=Torulaspora delbrueckii TaxID=4950 RepID=G8ZM35_TORDE|nr:hypothetical protein TDEL_0A03470 [Torulaspora delbrueckii]CCE89679.1 hypothetical protein TDEL_0A03470 [Torulaspora delbrueckii]